MSTGGIDTDTVEPGGAAPIGARAAMGTASAADTAARGVSVLGVKKK